MFLEYNQILMKGLRGQASAYFHITVLRNSYACMNPILKADLRRF
jgi:hypothetical protein